ncbi:spatacsin [Ambystoma mexicanum]|uniref:spatacsin n=1 Tax=Ambystoma mexicanum TaxID=8296 RepID=UPI0037E73A59
METLSKDLCVLLLPTPDSWEQGDSCLPVRSALTGRRDLILCNLSTLGSLHVTTFPFGSLECLNMCINGHFLNFMWEKTEESANPPTKRQLLTLTEDFELQVYKVGPVDGTLALICQCNQDTLMQLLPADVNGCSRLQCVRLLTFETGCILFLLNDVVLVQLAIPEGGGEPVTRSCFVLKFSPEVSTQIVDGQLCRGILFLLDSAGWIYAFDRVDGLLLAHIDLALYQALVTEEKDLGTPFTTLKVSHDLSVLVITDGLDHVLAIDLNIHFRQYPEQLLGRCFPDTRPVIRPEGLDEEELACSYHNVNILKCSFQPDRSWEARLSSMSKMTKWLDHQDSVLHMDNWWYQAFPHKERYEGTEEHVEPVGNSCRLPGKMNGARSQWKHIPGKSAPGRLQCVSVSSFTALFTRGESRAMTMILWDLTSQEIAHHCITCRGIPVHSDTKEQVCLVLTDKGLSLLIFGLIQEEFLNRLMIHGCASTVDSLCHLNHWDRCSIPLHALEAGLKNRQLDTVDFFLKSKENLFSPLSQCMVLETPGSIEYQTYLKDVEDLRPALDLLCSAIRENDLETQSKPFSEQLLNLTLKFLNKQIQELCNHADELDECLQSCMDILTSYITNLRTFMKKFNRQQSLPVSASKDSCDDTLQIEQSQQWESMNLEQVIADAILSNRIPEAQAFLRLNGYEMHRLDQLTCVGLDVVYNRLLKENVTEASMLLRNMGLSVKEELHRICLYTTDKHIRNLLVQLLEGEQYLSKEEKDMIENVCKVEKHYSATSISDEDMVTVQRCWRKGFDLSDPEAVLKSFLRCSGQERKSAQECSIILQWAQHWDNLIQEEILLSRRSEEELVTCLPEVLWMHLTSLHDWPKVFAWIAASVHKGSLVAAEGGSWPLLTIEIVDQNTQCSHYMRHEILDQLARYSVFVPSEFCDLDLLLQRLACNGGLMQEQAPVPQYRSQEGLDFNTSLILYCIQNNLPYLLYTYLDYYSLTPADCAVLGSRDLHKAHPWFEFLVQVREVARNPGDLGWIFPAALANAQILIPSDKAGLSSMLLEGHTLLALASAMYTPGGIDQIVGVQELCETSLETVDPQLLKVALTPYPKLKAALFPQYTSHSIAPPDVSLYHLIQALAPFDPSGLFGWQSTNTLAGADVSNDLPHFSCLELVNKYAVIERLDYSYYLRHGRPSFAFGNFLVQQLGRSKCPKQLIQQAGSEVYALALSSFCIPSVIAACVCFLELLGRDSLKLRVDIKVAKLILSHKPGNMEEPSPSDLREAIAEKLLKLLETEQEAAQDLLMWLESTFWDTFRQEGSGSSSEEALQQWSLVMTFCRLHNLHPSTSFLRECAKSHNWLQFIVLSQIHSYQPDEVHSILVDFGDVPLQDHLALAFENLQFSAAPLGSEKDVVCKEVKTWRHQPPPGNTSDIFQVLFCSWEDPAPWRFLLSEAVRWRAPLFSVLAACLQGVNTIHCLCVWIITWVDEMTAVETTAHLDGAVETHEWCLHDLATIWKTLLGKQRSKPLIWALQIFLKDCPLLSILEVYELCMEHKDYTQAKVQLLAFQQSLLMRKAADVKADVLLPVAWLEAQALFVLELMMQQCRTQYEFGNLMQLFAELDTVLISNGLDVKKLCALSKVLKDTSISIDRSVLSDYSPERLRQECASILEQLQKQGLFSLAKEVAALGDLPVDLLVIEELNQDQQTLQRTDQWHRKKARIDFWRKCHESFSSHSISSRSASAFFSTQAESLHVPPEGSHADEGMEALSEKHLLLSMSGHWLAKENPVQLAALEGLEREIWLCRIAQQTLIVDHEWIQGRFARQVSIGGDLSFDQLAKQFSFSKLAALNTSEYLRPEDVPHTAGGPLNLGHAEVQSLNHLIGRLLDDSCIHEASRVCRYFGFGHPDVCLVLHCRALAAGEISVSERHPVLYQLLRDEEADHAVRGRKSRLQKDSGLEGDSSFVMIQNPDAQLVQDLEMLTDKCIHGKNYCRQVLCLYQLSKELGCTYSEISAQDSHQLLRAILSSQQPNTCEKAQAFISTQGLQPQMVAELVAEEALRQLQASCDGKGQKQVCIHISSSEEFLQLAKLCQDPTLVGMELLENLGSVPRAELAYTVEILIAAHECFTLTCHLEGIMLVLQAAQHLTESHLAPSDEYTLLVRLLTGIGRYSEMTYIFDLLHRKHHFEVLMRKKLDAKGGLKTALLDYIKRCHPGDSEKHNMVALCFSMHREIGENHEAAANIQLKLIESLPWEDSLENMPLLIGSLMKTLTLLIDAAESYAKESCVRQSLRCSRLAKLITLQLHFLNNNQKTKLINLEPEVLMNAIRALPRFYQASIVAEAYAIIPDWAEVLYKRVVVDGEFTYLEEFKQHHMLKGCVFEDVSKKFQQHRPTPSTTHNLKKLLGYCEDIFLYYQLAYNNKFYDVVNILLKEPQTSCYLKDMLSC